MWVADEMPAGCRQFDPSYLPSSHVPDAHFFGLSLASIMGVVHRAIAKIFLGRCQLHSMRQFNLVGSQSFSFTQVLHMKPIEVIPDSRNEFLIIQPHEVRAATNRSVIGFEAKCGDPI